MKISLLINMKMPTIVGIFISISRESFMLSCVEHEKKLYNPGVRLRECGTFLNVATLMVNRRRSVEKQTSDGYCGLLT